MPLTWPATERSETARFEVPRLLVLRGHHGSITLALLSHSPVMLANAIPATMRIHRNQREPDGPKYEKTISGALERVT